MNTHCLPISWRTYITCLYFCKDDLYISYLWALHNKYALLTCNLAIINIHWLLDIFTMITMHCLLMIFALYTFFCYSWSVHNEYIHFLLVIFHSEYTLLINGEHVLFKASLANFVDMSHFLSKISRWSTCIANLWYLHNEYVYA